MLVQHSGHCHLQSGVLLHISTVNISMYCNVVGLADCAADTDTSCSISRGKPDLTEAK